MRKDWKDIADSILETIKTRAKEFLDENSEAKDFIAERAQSLAKLTVEYKQESIESRRKDILHEMNLELQSIENTLSTMALKGKEESKAIFKEIVGTALGALIKYLPAILPKFYT
jgi:cbb3-type cytochrome oxidase cytochrome c subunit